MDPLLRAPGHPEESAADSGLLGGSRPHRVVWERAAELAVEVFRLAAREDLLEPSLCAPLRAAAVAVPTCLARALGRGALGVARNQLFVALGALAEVESHLALAARLRGSPFDGLGQLRGRVDVVRRLILVLGTPERRSRSAQDAIGCLDSKGEIR